MVSRDQLVAAFGVWTVAGGKALAELLVEQGALIAPRRGLLEALAAEHMAAHGGDPEKSLAALDVNHSTRESLARIGGLGIETSLACVGSGLASSQSDGDPDLTANYSVGTATSDGQRFRVLRPHAKGGLGAVFVALDSELNREVALKQILDSHAHDPASRQRFLLEAEVTGGLEHPGIVPVYGLGTHGDGRPFYAMRFIRGDTLKEAIDRFHNEKALKNDAGRRLLELRKLLHRFTDVCNAIDYAHSRGVLHRDIKPANIVVGRYGETLVVDWGLAKATGKSDPSAGERTLMPSSASGSSETLPGSALGTPAYMSPEQAEGDLDRLSARSDVYSLGATLYCVLTGRPPFTGDVVDVISAVQRGDFRPPRQLDSNIDPALEAVCLKAMALRPADRYPTPRALAEDVEKWAADEPVTAWREPVSRRTRRWARRNRTAVTAASVALVAGVVGLAAVLAVQTKAKAELARSLFNETKANRELAAANAELGRSQAAVQARFDLAVDAIRTFHTGVSEDFLLKEEKFKELRDRLLKSASDFYGKLAALLGRDSDRASRLALLQANFDVAELTADVGRPEDALAAHRNVLAAREALASEPGSGDEAKADVGRSLIAVGSLLNSVGKTAEAEAAYRAAEQRLAGPTGSAPPDAAVRAALASCRSQLGGLLYSTGHTANALSILRLARAELSALAAAAGATDSTRSDLAQSINLLGTLLWKTGQPSEAEAEYRSAIAIRQKLADHNPGIAQFRSSLSASHYNLGLLLLDTVKSAEAEAEIRAALVIDQRLADDNPAVTYFRNSLANGHSYLGYLLWKTGKAEEAAAAFRKSLAIEQRLAAENPSITDFANRLAYSHRMLGTLLADAGSASEAEVEYRKALAIQQNLSGAYPGVTGFREYLALIHSDLGLLLSTTGKAAEAEAEYRAALAISRKLANDNPAVTSYRGHLANGAVNLAANLLALGRGSEALATADQAVVLAEALLVREPRSAYYRAVLGEALLRRGQARLASAEPGGAVTDWRLAAASFEATPPDQPEAVFVEACCHAMLAGAAGRPGTGVPSGEGPVEAERAMGMLRRAVSMGFRDAGRYRIDPALAPLRDRDDFRLLIMDLVMPDRPFAP